MSNTWFRVKERIFPLLFLDTPHYMGCQNHVTDFEIGSAEFVGTWCISIFGRYAGLLVALVVLEVHQIKHAL